MLDGFIETNMLLYLDLSNNKLSNLPDDIRNLTSVKNLKMSGNTFKCSCKSFWMKEWLLNETKVVDDFENIKCQMKGVKVSYLSFILTCYHNRNFQIQMDLCS